VVLPVLKRTSLLFLHIHFIEVLERHGYTSQGYDEAIEEIVNRTEQRVAGQFDRASRSEIEAEAHDEILRLAFARLGDPALVIASSKEFLQDHGENEVAALNKYLFEKHGPLRHFNH
jgi:hypothetical protein